MTVTVYGIPNCDTVKKARKWLDAQRLAHDFHDYKKQPPQRALLRQWVSMLGWEILLNRRGTTFRALDEGEKADIDEDKAIALMERHPSLIKRPVLDVDGKLLVGFDPGQWAALLG